MSLRVVYGWYRRTRCHRLLPGGAAVAVCGRTQKRIEAFNQECHARGVTVFAQADAGNIEELQRFADEVLGQYGHIDIWINNVGINIGKKLWI